MDALWSGRRALHAGAQERRAHSAVVRVTRSGCWSAIPTPTATSVLPAILLHDCGWAVVEQQVEQVGPGMHRVRHAARARDRGRADRRAILDARWPSTCDEVATIIDGHDSRLQALSLNDELVKDADKLWRYTTAGVAVGCDWFAMTPGRIRRPGRGRTRARDLHRRGEGASPATRWRRRERRCGYERYDAVVLGGGHHATIIACYLARAGLSVGVFERAPYLGGGANTSEGPAPGFLMNHCSHWTRFYGHPAYRDFSCTTRGCGTCSPRATRG